MKFSTYLLVSLIVICHFANAKPLNIPIDELQSSFIKFDPAFTDQGKIDARLKPIPIDLYIDSVERNLMIAERGEFETSDDYKNRQNTLLDKYILGSIKLINAVAFELPLNSFREDPGSAKPKPKTGLKYYYNADKKTLNLYLISGSPGAEKSESLRPFFQKNDDQSLRDAIMFEILNSSADSYNIAFPELYYISNKSRIFNDIETSDEDGEVTEKIIAKERDQDGNITFKLKRIKLEPIAKYEIDNSIAEKFALDLASLIVLNPVRPYVLKNSSPNYATEKYIFANPVCIILYKHSTKEIIRIFPTDKSCHNLNQ